MAEIEIDRTDDWPPRTIVRCRGRMWLLGESWSSTNPGELVAKLFLWLVLDVEDESILLAPFEKYEVT